jgi:hypothetical protein
MGPTEKNATDVAVEGGLVGVGAAATVALAAGAPLAGALAAAPLALNAVVQSVLHRNRRRWALWYEGYRKAADIIQPEVLEAKLQANAEDPIVQELIVESARAIGEAIVDVIAPIMARLTRLYESERRPADAFFRGMRRVLTDLSTEEFADFREIISRTLRAPYDPTTPWFVVENESWPDRSRFVIRAVHGANSGQTTTTTSPHEWGAAPPTAPRVLHLLEANGLAQPMRQTGLSVSVLIASETVQRIWAVIS